MLQFIFFYEEQFSMLNEGKKKAQFGWIKNTLKKYHFLN